MTVQLRNAWGDPLPGVSVRLSASGAVPATITPSTGTTDASGTLDAVLAGRLFASASTGVFRIDSNGVVWKQTPAGEVDASLGLPDPVRTLAFDPSRPGVVYAATANGVYVTASGGE